MSGNDKGHAATPAVDRCHELLRWIVPVIDRFPRSRRFTLGDRLESTLLDVLALVLRAAFHHDKVDALQEANVRLALTRHLWRLALELTVISPKAYEQGSRLMLDLGRQIGGWHRSLGKRAGS